MDLLLGSQSKVTIQVPGSSSASSGVSPSAEARPKVKVPRIPGMDPEKRISLWNKQRSVRLSGGNAPIYRDLAHFLRDRPEYEIYNGEPKLSLCGVYVERFWRLFWLSRVLCRCACCTYRVLRLCACGAC